MRNGWKHVAALCRARGAVVETGLFDLCEGTSGPDFIRTFDAAHPIDLLIVNAGIFSGHHAGREMEDSGEIVAMLRTNLEAAILTITAALPRMRARRSGRIAIIGSLAASAAAGRFPGLQRQQGRPDGLR